MKFVKSELIKLLKTDEVINWRSLIEHFEQDLKVGDSLYPATDAFKSEEGAKRWSDFKTRIVEHVSAVDSDLSQTPGFDNYDL
jgi:hypothetical protein